MVKPDWDAPEFSLPEPGWYHVEVGKAEFKSNDKGNAWFSVRLGEVDSNRGIAFDNIFVRGKAAGMGNSKLKCLGIAPGSDVEVEDLNGKRAWVYILHGTYTGKDGKPKAKTEVDVKASDAHCGYLSEDEYKERGSSLAPIDNWKRTDGTEGPADPMPF